VVTGLPAFGGGEAFGLAGGGVFGGGLVVPGAGRPGAGRGFGCALGDAFWLWANAPETGIVTKAAAAATNAIFFIETPSQVGGLMRRKARHDSIAIIPFILSRCNRFRNRPRLFFVSFWDFSQG
jgi:hypothetical protein